MSECSKAPDGKHRWSTEGKCIWCGRKLQSTQDFLSKHFHQQSKTRPTYKGERLPGYQRTRPPPPEECARIREIVVQAVFSRWNTTKKPSNKHHVYKFYLEKIEKLRTLGQWPYGTRSMRTVERRMNEAADKRFYPENTPTKLVAVTSGWYTVNPMLLSKMR